MSGDRLSQGYQPDFDLDRAIGEQGELFVEDISRALAAGLGEVKYDVRASQTGNVYIEFACRHRDGQYHSSGIDSTAADYWAFVLGRDAPAIAVVAPVELVRRVKEQAVLCGQTRQTIRGSHPTNGAIVPLGQLLLALLREADRAEAAA